MFDWIASGCIEFDAIDAVYPVLLLLMVHICRSLEGNLQADWMFETRATLGLISILALSFDC